MNSKKLGQIGMWMIIMGVVVSTCGFMGAFVFEDSLSLLAQVACHIVFFIAPLAVKVGYLVKLSADSQLNRMLANV